MQATPRISSRIFFVLMLVLVAILGGAVFGGTVGEALALSAFSAAFLVWSLLDAYRTLKTGVAKGVPPYEVRAAEHPFSFVLHVLVRGALFVGSAAVLWLALSSMSWTAH